MWFFDDPDEEMASIEQGDKYRADLEAASQQVTPQQVARALYFQRLAPTASPGVIVSSAVSDLSDEQFMSIASMDDGGEAPDSFSWWNPLDYVGAALGGTWEQAIKPILRGAFTISESLFEEVVQRPLLTISAMEDDPGLSLSDAYTMQGNSVGVNAAKALLDGPGGNRFDLGTGILPAGEVRRLTDEGRQYEINGQTANIGRLITSESIGRFGADPGERAYDITAGVVQFVYEVALDPLNLLTGGTAGVARRSAAEAAQQTTKTAASVVSEIESLRKAALASKAITTAEEFVVPDELLTRAVGLVNGQKRTVLLDRALPFVRDSDVLQSIADTRGYQLREAWSKSSANRLPTEVISALGDASTTDEVALILTGELAKGWKPDGGFYRGWRADEALTAGPTRRSVFDSKFAGISPTGIIRSDDVPMALDKVDSYLRQARLPREVRADLWEKGARLIGTEDGGVAFRSWVGEAMTEVAKSPGIDSDLVQPFIERIQHVVDKTVVAGRAYNTDALANHAESLGDVVRQVVDDVVIDTPSVDFHISSELNDAFQFHLPDPKIIRRAAVKNDLLRRAFNSRQWDFTENMARVVTSGFKTAALTRAAYIARVLPESQMRMAAAGWESAVTDPFHYMFAQLTDQRAAVDLLDDSLEVGSAARKALGSAMQPLARKGRLVPSNLWGRALKSDPTGVVEGVPIESLRAWRRELTQLADDPASRWLAENPNNFDGLVDLYFNGARDNVTEIKLAASLKKEAAAVGLDDWTEDTLRAAAASWQKRLDVKTGGSSEIMSLVAGLLDDAPDLRDSRNWDGVATWLRQRADEWMPDAVKAEVGDKDFIDSLKPGLIDAASHWVIQKPDSYFSRYPLWRQAIGKNLEDLMPAISRDLRELVIKQSKGLGLDGLSERLRIAADKASDVDGFLDDIIEVNALSKDRAAQQVADLLFDVQNQSAFQQQFVALTPFVDAWREALEVWGGLVKQNPKVLSRGVQMLRTSNSTGIIYTDEETGEKMFSAPGKSIFAGSIAGAAAGGKVGGLAGAALGGVLGATAGLAGGAAIEGFSRDSVTGEEGDTRKRLTFRANGVNMVFSSIGPGFGPVVQWPVNAFPVDTAFMREVKDIVSPFGSSIESPSDFADPGSIATAILPAWLRKTLNGLSFGSFDEVGWNQAVHDSLRHLELSGKYTPEQLADPEFTEEITKRAKRGAAFQLLVRGVGQGTLITGPTSETQVRVPVEEKRPSTDWKPEEDRSGTWMSLAVLSNDWYDMVDQYGDYQTANQAFIEQYGIEPWWFTTAKTRVVGGGRLDITEESQTWLAENRALADAYPLIAGYLAPVDEGDDPRSYSIYRSMLESGQREFNTPRQQLALANSARARQMFHAARLRLEDSGLPPEQVKVFLGAVTGALEEQYPGWKDPIGGLSNVFKPDRLEQFARAAFDPALDASPIAEPLRIYFLLRQKSLDKLREATGDPRAALTRREGAVYADYLRQTGLALSQRSPEFRAAWDVLSSELED